MGKTFDITPEIDPKFPLRMAAMPLGMWEVTEENWGEFYVRIKLLELDCGGAFLKNAETGEPIFATPEMAKQHIGLPIRSKLEERGEWISRIFGNKSHEFEHDVRKFDGTVTFPSDVDDEEDDDN